MMSCALHAGDDLANRRRPPARAGAVLQPAPRCCRSGLDLVSGLCAAPGESERTSPATTGEAAALLISPRCLHGGVQRQDVGLEGDAIPIGLPMMSAIFQL